MVSGENWGSSGGFYKKISLP